MFALFLCGVRTRKSMTNDELRTQISQMGANGRNSIVNGQWLIVMRGTRYPNATLCHSEHSEESRGEEGRDSSLTL